MHAINLKPLIFILIITFILPACATTNKQRHKDKWFGSDKAKHFVVSAAIGASSSEVLKHQGHSDCHAAAGGLTFTLSMGAAKEYYDKRVKKTGWSWKDMFWNFIGGTVGSLASSGCH